MRRRLEYLIYLVCGGPERLLGRADLDLARIAAADLLGGLRTVGTLLERERGGLCGGRIGDPDQRRGDRGVLDRVGHDQGDALHTIADAIMLERQQVADLGAGKRRDLVRSGRVLVRDHDADAWRRHRLDRIDTGDAAARLRTRDHDDVIDCAVDLLCVTIPGITQRSRDLLHAFDPARHPSDRCGGDDAMVDWIGHIGLLRRPVAAALRPARPRARRRDGRMTDASAARRARHHGRRGCGTSPSRRPATARDGQGHPRSSPRRVREW